MGTHRLLYQVQVLGWTHIYTHSSQQCLFCCGTNSARCWTRSSESLYHISLYQDSVTQLLQIYWLHIHHNLLKLHPKGTLVDWNLVTVEDIWVHWTHCHVQDTSLCWSELWDIVCYPAGRTHLLMEAAMRRWVHCGHKGTVMASMVGCGVSTLLVLRDPKCTKKRSPTPLLLTTLKPDLIIITHKDKETDSVLLLMKVTSSKHNAVNKINEWQRCEKLTTPSCSSFFNHHHWHIKMLDNTHMHVCGSLVSGGVGFL